MARTRKTSWPRKLALPPCSPNPDDPRPRDTPDNFFAYIKATEAPAGNRLWALSLAHAKACKLSKYEPLRRELLSALESNARAAGWSDAAPKQTLAFDSPAQRVTVALSEALHVVSRARSVTVQ